MALGERMWRQRRAVGNCCLSGETSSREGRGRKRVENPIVEAVAYGCPPVVCWEIWVDILMQRITRQAALFTAR